MTVGASAADRRDRPRILVIEDEPMLALSLEDFLVDAGFEVSGIAGLLETALAMIEIGEFDAAIVDANLAGVSAGPAASALTARRLPFIVFSGYLPEQQKEAFLGAVFVQKPCRPNLLIESLRKILSTRVDVEA